MTGQQAFVSIYAGLAATLALACALVWRRSQPPVVPSPRLANVELAALNGGPRLAAAVAAMELRKRDGGGASELAGDAADGAAIRAVLEKLETIGLRLGLDAALYMRALWCSGVVLAVAGGVALVAAIAGAPIDWPTAGATAATAGAIVVITRWCGRRLWATAAGLRLLRGIRADRAAELRSVAGHPTLAVAIFGSEVLWAVDADLARRLQVRLRCRTALGGGHDAALSAGWNVGCSCG